MVRKLCALFGDPWALFFALSVMVITFASATNPSAGWLWDLAHGLGYGAVACLLYVCFATPGRRPAKAHQVLSYAALAFVALHVGLLLLGDPVSIEFLKPAAPAYMWAGVLATLLILYLIISSLPGTKGWFHRDRNNYRHWHRNLAWLVMAGSLYHIAVSALYINNLWQLLAIALLSFVALWPLTPVKTRVPAVHGVWGGILALSLVFAGLRVWLL